MIDRASIDKVLEAARIEDVVRDFVDLKKRGTSLVANCPFHDEKTPSFHVSVSKGIFKCFSCGKGGDALSFVMEHEKYTYPEAIRYLAKKYQIELEETKTSAAVLEANTQRESLFVVSQFAAKFFQYQLSQTDEGKSIGLSYFKERGFSTEIIQKFELGYSPETWDALYQGALKEGFQTSYLLDTGLIIKNDQGKIYDRFRTRVLFPIHNFTGRIIGFGGRTLKSDKSIPKYVNSPESDIYHKSKVLYGLFQAKKAIRTEDNCYLVEGYADVLSVHQAGVENVVSSSGTSLTTEQIKLIQRFTENITILFDGDAAGIKAALRGLDMVLEHGLNVKVVLFPDGHDPDSYMQLIGATAFKQYIEQNRQEFIFYKTTVLLKDAGKDPIKKAQVISDVLESIAKIPEQIKSEIFIKQCSALLEVEERSLFTELNKIRYRNSQQNRTPARAAEANEPIPPSAQLTTENDSAPAIAPSDFIHKTIEYQEVEVLRLILNYGALEVILEDEEKMNVATYIISNIDDIDFIDPICEEIIGLYKSGIENNQIPNLQTLIRHENIKITEFVVSCVSEPYSLSENWVKKVSIYVNHEKDHLLDTLHNGIYHLKKRKITEMMHKKLLILKNTEDPEDQIILMNEYAQLKEADRYFSKQLGIVIG